MFALDMVGDTSRESPRRRIRRPSTFPNDACRELAERVCKLPSLRQAANAIIDTALSLPETSDWYTYLHDLGVSLLCRTPSVKVMSEEGNTKLPFVSWSVLPFITCPGMGECEKFCYSRGAWRYPGGFVRQLQNTLLMKHLRHIVTKSFMAIPSTMRAVIGVELVGYKRNGRPRYLPITKEAPTVFRLYVDGDFASVEEVDYWMGLLKLRPEIQAYGYSKSWNELWQWGLTHTWPDNYVLNLSSGGREQAVSKERMFSLPITRNEFLAVEYEHYKTGKKGRAGFERYDDPRYHNAIRASARGMGLPKAFSCPGKCGECSPHGHVCGSHKFDNVVVVNGVH